MKSKTSFFNKTIFKKNVTHYWPLWVAYLSFMLLGVPFTIWQNATSQWYYSIDEDIRMYAMITNAVDNIIAPLPIFLVAAVMALAVFSYLYFAKNANIIHALPVNRLELFVTNYLSGLSFLVLPQIIVFFVSILVCLANEITCIQYLFTALLCQMGMSFFAYSLAVFVAMFTGQILAMPVYYLIINFLYVGCVFIVNAVKELLCYGVTGIWNPGKTCILSPLYYLLNNVWVNRIYDKELNNLIKLEINGERLVAIYAVAAVVIVIMAYQLYQRRQIETAGDWVSIGFVKPVFRWGVAFCGSVLFSIFFTNILRESHHVNIYVCMLICMIVTGFIGFFMAEMLLHKNFKVFKKKHLIEWAGYTVVAVLFLTLFKMDVFGIGRSIPNVAQIDAAFVDMDYPIEIKGEDIQKLLDIQRDVIAHRKEYQDLERGGEGFYYTTFRYYLKDGTISERRYPIPVEKEYLEDEMSPASKILAWERKEENLKQHILGINYEENRYVSGNIDLYNEEEEYQSYMLSETETAVIAEAVERDIEDGNFTINYLPSIAGDKRNCGNNITLNCYNSSSYYDNWDYYNNYKENKRGGVREEVEVVQKNNYICFGNECVHTIKALEDLEITNSMWKLYTQIEH